MARTNAAYKMDYAASIPAHPATVPRRGQPASQPLARPRLRAIPGKGLGAQTSPALHPRVRALVVVAVLLVLVAATVSVARIAVSSLTVQMMLQGERISENIANARSQGLELEVKHSLATNPNRVQDAATTLGMVPDNQVQTLSAQQGFSFGTRDLMVAAASERLAAEVAAEAAAQTSEPEAHLSSDLATSE